MTQEFCKHDAQPCDNLHSNRVHPTKLTRFFVPVWALRAYYFFACKYPFRPCHFFSQRSWFEVFYWSGAKFATQYLVGIQLGQGFLWRFGLNLLMGTTKNFVCCKSQNNTLIHGVQVSTGNTINHTFGCTTCWAKFRDINTINEFATTWTWPQPIGTQYNGKTQNFMFHIQTAWQILAKLAPDFYWGWRAWHLRGGLDTLTRPEWL